jgi:hypothetical protein
MTLRGETSFPSYMSDERSGIVIAALEFDEGLYALRRLNQLLGVLFTKAHLLLSKKIYRPFCNDEKHHYSKCIAAF